MSAKSFWPLFTLLVCVGIALIVSRCAFTPSVCPPRSTVNLPDGPFSSTGQGFTCTGMVYDTCERMFYVGDIGTVNPDDTLFHPCIEVLSEDLKHLVRTIPLYKHFPVMKTVQGVAVDYADNTLWLCSFEEGLIRHITKQGEHISSIELSQPTGIAYDATTGHLWVLTYDALMEMTKTGNVLRSFEFHEAGQDQICVKGDTIYVTSGLDYHNPQYLHLVDKRDGYKIATIQMDASFAIEGVVVIDSLCYIANDGLYHKAREPRNVIQEYNLQCVNP